MAYQGYKGYGSPESIERKRAIAEALASRMFQGRDTPKNYGDAIYQGLGDVGAALMSRGITKKADKAEREAREASASRSSGLYDIVASLTGGGASRRSAAPAPTGGPSSIDPDGRGTAPQQWSPGMVERAISEPPVDTAALKGVAPGTVDAFGNLQASYGQPLTVTSGLRTPEHNARVGGAGQSRHMAEHGGDAIDIDTSGMSEADRLRLIQDASAQGFTGIGVYDNSIHLDRGQRRAWGPSYGRESVPSWAQPAIETHLASSGAQPSGSMTGDRVAQSGQSMTDAGPQIDMEALQVLQGVLNDPWAAPADKQMAAMILEQELSKMQPMAPADRYKVVGGRLVDLAAEGGPSVTIDAPDDPSALDEKIETLMTTGLDRTTATNIAAGRWRLDRDPVSGVAQVVDMGTGQVLGRAPQGAGAAAATGRPGQAETGLGVSDTSVPSDVDYGSALGAEGFGSNIANTVMDAIGADLPAPQAERATQALKNLQVRTQTMLQDAVPGRPSNYLLQRIDELTITPSSLFQGEARAYERMRQTRDLIRRAVEENQAIVQNPSGYKPDAVSKARININQFNSLLRDYETILGTFEERAPANGGRQGANEGGWHRTPGGVRYRIEP